MKNLPFCLSVALLGIVPFVAPATAQKYWLRPRVMLLVRTSLFSERGF